MTAADQCPTPAALEDFLRGRGPTDLDRHLAGCAPCAGRAAGLRPDDALVIAVRRSAAGDTPVPVLTEELASVFRRLLPAGETVGWVEPRADLDPGAAGELGRVGPYPVFEVLGAGGMGVVYRGFDPALERPVAIKVIRPALLAAPGVVERFLAEARAAAKVEHDGIVVVHAVEVHAGRPCLVMPLLKGQTLEARLKAGALPPGEVLRVGREAAVALAAAHAAGLVHRDIKPGNLWLEAPTGRVRVLDFGLAVAAGGGGGSGFAGTPGYMAPEQVRGRGVDHRADLFSLGCVLYRMVAGVGPFDAETASGTLIRTLTRPPAAPPAAPALADLIERLLARSPADRPDSAAAVADELAALEGAAATRRRRVVRRRWLAGLVTAAGLGGLAAWFLQEPPTAPPAPVAVTITTDPDDGPLILAGDEGDVRVAGGGDTTVSLLPGNYTVRAAAPTGRVPVPAAFVVQPGEPARVKVALVGEVAVTKAHGGAVTGVAVVRDGPGFAVLSASLDRTLQRWEPGKGDPRHARLAAPAECLAASADGGVVLTGGGTKQRGPDAADPFGLRLERWDGRTLTAAGDPLAGHGRIVKVLAVSADGRYAVSADRDELIVWNLRGGDPVRLPTPDRASVQAAAFEPDGHRVLIGDEAGAATLRDAARPDPPLRVFTPPGENPAAVKAVAVRPDGYATGCADGTVWLWDKAFTPTRVATPTEVLALAVSLDGRRLLAAGADGAVRLVSAPRGEVVHTLAGHAGRVRGVAFTPDGRGAVSGGEDRTVRLWRLPFE